MGAAIRIGNGLLQDKENMIATKAGILRASKRKNGRTRTTRASILVNFCVVLSYWVENNQKRYVPVPEDMVIGIINDKMGENYKVDIGSSSNASLPVLAFEGATKRNRPQLNVSTVVYARVLVANKDMETELVCFAPNNKAEGYGELTGGYIFKCTIGLARSLLSPTCPILAALSKRIPFELAVGMNGRVWVNSQSTTNTILITNAILNSEFLHPAHLEQMVLELLQRADR